MKLRAAAYIRVSTADQTEYSPDAQLKQIREYAKGKNIELLDEHIYADEGISGRTTYKRTAFNNMIKNAKKKPRPFDVILIHKFNRFARNREDAIIYKSLLKRDCGIKVISITEPIEDGKIGIIIESVLDAFAEYYSLNLADEVKKGMSEKASRGGIQARPPLGYSIHDNKLVINEKESQIIKLIFNKYLEQGTAYIDIANYLNELGIKTKNGNRFQSKSIKYILTNPIYKGYVRWNRKNKNGSIKNPSEWIIAKGDFEPIISEQQFEEVQKKICLNSSNRKTRPKGEYKHFLSGLLICKNCGGKMVYSKQRGYEYYRCRKAKEGGCEIRSSIRVDVLEHAILSQINKDFNNIELIVTNKKDSNKNTDIEFYKQQLKKIESKLNLAKHAFLNGVDSLEEYKNNKKEFLKEKENILNRINEVSKKEENKKQKSIIHKLGSINDILNEKLSIPKKNQILRSFIKGITLDIPNDKFEIEYYVNDNF